MLEWLSACEQTSRGRLFLDNLGIDLSLGTLTSAELREFSTNLQAFRFTPDPERPPPPGTERYRSAAFDAISSGGLFLRGPVTNLPCNDLSTVTPFDEMMAWLWFDLSWVGGLGDSKAVEALIEELNLAADYNAFLKPTAEFRTGLPMLWMTQRDAICSLHLTAPQSTQADAVRDVLGLQSYGQDVFLCRIDLDASDLRQDSLRRPTAFDGGLTLVFRSNLAPDPHGLAVDLRTRRPATVEVVHPPVRLTGRHRFNQLGRVTYTADFSWEDLAETVETGRLAAAKAELAGGASGV